jgi:hypothetical protein
VPKDHPLATAKQLADDAALSDLSPLFDETLQLESGDIAQ